MNEFPAFAAIIGLLGLIRSLSLLGKESFKDLQAAILGDASCFLRAGLGALCAFFAFRLYDYNSYGSSKFDIFGIPMLFWGNIFWATFFLFPIENSKIAINLKTFHNKIACKIGKTRGRKNNEN